MDSLDRIKVCVLQLALQLAQLVPCPVYPQVVMAKRNFLIWLCLWLSSCSSRRWSHKGIHWRQPDA